MRRLPALVTGSSRWILPMADRSAELLAETVLVGDAPKLGEALHRQLALDPPLLLWTICLAARHNQRPRCVHEASAWLAGRALTMLEWDGAEGARFDAPDAVRAEEYADRVAAAVELGELSAELAGDADAGIADEARLLGLLHLADQWQTDRAKKAAAAHLPGWLTDESPSAARRHVARAMELLADQHVPDSLVTMVTDCQARAAEGRRCWLEAVPGVGARLPQLTARLTRLVALEERFQETLEQEKLSALAEFAAGAGHEINNPVAVIAGRAQLFLREETDPERRRALALMNAQAKRVYEMIADMRLFARPPEPVMETVDLVALVNELIEDLAPQAAERAVILSRRGTDGPLPIEADPVQLQVALRAMCKNAVEAIGHDGRIEIAVESDDRRVRIRVIDSGCA